MRAIKICILSIILALCSSLAFAFEKDYTITQYLGEMEYEQFLQAMQILSGEQILAEIMTMQTESDNIGLIVIDSIPALVTAQNLKNEFTKDMGKQGTIAKSMHKFLTEITPSLEEK